MACIMCLKCRWVSIGFSTSHVVERLREKQGNICRYPPPPCPSLTCQCTEFDPGVIPEGDDDRRSMAKSDLRAPLLYCYMMTHGLTK